MPEAVGVEAEESEPDGMERAAPEFGLGPGKEVADAIHHFARGLVGEGEEKDALGADAVFQQPRNAVDQCARLAGARASQDECWTRACGNGGKLLFIELAGVIDAELDLRRRRGLEHVLTRHGTHGRGERGKFKGGRGVGPSLLTSSATIEG